MLRRRHFDRHLFGRGALHFKRNIIWRRSWLDRLDGMDIQTSRRLRRHRCWYVGRRRYRCLRKRHGRRRWRRRGCVRRILHDLAQTRRRARLNARPRPRQNIVGGPDLRQRFASGWRKCRLQGADGFVKRQPVHLQNLRSRTASISNNSRQHDGAIDVAPPSTTCGRRSRFENTRQRLRYAKPTRRRNARQTIEICNSL
mgnify:CR=1 FL=1